MQNVSPKIIDIITEIFPNGVENGGRFYFERRGKSLARSFKFVV